MKSFILLLIALFLFACSDDNSTNSNVNIPTYHYKGLDSSLVNEYPCKNHECQLMYYNQVMCIATRIETSIIDSSFSILDAILKENWYEKIDFYTTVEKKRPDLVRCASKSNMLLNIENPNTATDDCSTHFIVDGDTVEYSDSLFYKINPPKDDAIICNNGENAPINNSVNNSVNDSILSTPNFVTYDGYPLVEKESDDYILKDQWLKILVAKDGKILDPIIDSSIIAQGSDTTIVNYKLLLIDSVFIMAEPNKNRPTYTNIIVDSTLYEYATIETSGNCIDTLGTQESIYSNNRIICTNEAAFCPKGWVLLNDLAWSYYLKNETFKNAMNLNMNSYWVYTDSLSDCRNEESTHYMSACSNHYITNNGNGGYHFVFDVDSIKAKNKTICAQYINGTQIDWNKFNFFI